MIQRKEFPSIDNDRTYSQSHPCQHTHVIANKIKKLEETTSRIYHNLIS